MKSLQDPLSALYAVQSLNIRIIASHYNRASNSAGSWPTRGICGPEEEAFRRMTPQRRRRQARGGEGSGGGRVERAGSGCSSVPGRPGPNKLSTWWRCVRACVREARGVDAAASARSACPASSSQSVYAVPAAGVIVALRTSQTSACLSACC